MPQTVIYNMPLIIYKTNNKTKLVLKKELTEKNSVETHEGGLGQDDPESKQKVKVAYVAAAKMLDWSNQDEPSFEELDVAETEELAENNPGEPGEVVQMRDESENGKGLGEA